MTPLRRRVIEDMRIRNLAPNTQRAYVEQVARADHCRRFRPQRFAIDMDRKTASTRARTGRFRSVIDPMRGAAYRKGLLRRPPIRLPLILACRPALLELLLQRTERLVSRAANGADQSDAVLEERVEILAHKPML